MSRFGPHEDDKVPSLSRLGIPREEYRDARYIESSLQQLNVFVEHFEEALVLFDLCRDRYDALLSRYNARDAIVRQAFLWKLICAKDGAMTIFHFRETMKGIKFALGELPGLREKVQKPHLRLADRLFRQKFSQYEALRHSVAHAGELFTDRLLFQQNAPRDRSMIRNVIRGRKFSNTIDGKVFSYEISEGTLNHLNLVKREFYKAFRPIYLDDP